MKTIQMTFFVALFIICAACNKKEDNLASNAKNELSFKIDGVEWKAEREIIGMFHPDPENYNKVIIIGGSKGPNDGTEQDFTLNIFNTAAEGEYNFKNGNADLSVVQLSNLSSANYLCGGTFQTYNMKVKITKIQNNPTIMEAIFSGEIACVEGNTIKITDGKFNYYE